MKLSVIVPVYNAESVVAVQLEALARQVWSEPWEVLIANNRCTDRSMEIVEQYRSRLPNLRIIDASLRQGQPFALNTGVEHAQAEAVAFCDADDEIAPGWVAAMGNALQTHEFVACRFDIDKLNEDWVRLIHNRPQVDGIQQYTDPPFLPHAGGGGLGVRKAIHQTVGGFDESLPLLHDTDFCWRVQMRGHQLQFVPEAVLHVRYRHSLQGIYRQARGYAEYNVILYKRYRQQGMPAADWRRGMRAWWPTLRKLLKVRSKAALAKWLWQFGWRMGRLQASVKHRVLAF